MQFLDIFSKKQPKNKHLTPHFEDLNGLFLYFPTELKLEKLTPLFPELPEAEFRVLKANIEKIRNKYSLEKRVVEDQGGLEIRKLKEIKGELIKEKQALEDSVSRLKAKLSEAQTLIFKLEIENKNLVKSLIASPSPAKQEEGLDDSRTEEIEGAVARKGLEIEDLKGLLGKAEEEGEKWRRKTDKLKEKMKDLGEKYREIEGKNEKLAEKYEVLKQERAEIEEKREKNKEKNRKNAEELEARVEKLTRRNKDLKSEILSLKAQLELKEIRKGEME